MSCLNVSVSRIGDGLSSQGSYAGEYLKVSVSLAKKILSSIASDASPHLKVKASRIGSGLVVKCSIVCSLSEFTKWLNVSPSEVQWITDEIGVFYDVRSNVEWIINVE